jgi:hypothetical protein
VVLYAHKQKSYHLGFGNSGTRSNLAKANENCNHKIFEEFVYMMIDIVRKKLNKSDLEI